MFLLDEFYFLLESSFILKKLDLNFKRKDKPKDEVYYLLSLLFRTFS